MGLLAGRNLFCDKVRLAVTLAGIVSGRGAKAQRAPCRGCAQGALVSGGHERETEAARALVR
jgi:hypothetical protein